MDNVLSTPEFFYLINLRGTLETSSLGGKDRSVIGGKAAGLLAARDMIADFDRVHFKDIKIDIPSMAVLTTDVFDAFMQRNRLDELDFSSLADRRIAHAFQNADMPFEVLGSLRSLMETVTDPLALRSSGMLEDITERPFSGVYKTKMIPNNQLNADVRFQKLVEAVKYVWASTYFKISRDYCKAIGKNITEEKMAVILQRVAGKRHKERFYPELSGVARSYNFYPLRPAKAADGVVDLALGLGKTVVDGDKTWTYSPEYPNKPPPFESVQEMLEQTQTVFWAINLGEPDEYDPLSEVEYMQKKDLLDAEEDKVLRYLASTYDPQSERVSMGINQDGPRLLTFAPLLSLNELPFNRLVTALLQRCEKVLGVPVEIEFAMTFDPHHFAFLQVRPMLLPNGDFKVTREELRSENLLAASENVLGNGWVEDIQDVVYVLPQKFEKGQTRQIASELEQMNDSLMSLGRPYLLIVFGRLGTFDPWLGIPVAWGQIGAARVIIEATQDNVKVELSQGSHYFHNIINLGIKYFSMPFSKPYQIDWDWLDRQEELSRTDNVRHVHLPSPLKIKVDGLNSRGVILKN